MEGFGIEKLSLILVIVLVLFGARRIPEIGGSIGKGIREFKRGIKDMGNDVEDAKRPDQLSAPSPSTEQSDQPTPDPKRLLNR